MNHNKCEQTELTDNLSKVFTSQWTSNRLIQRHSSHYQPISLVLKKLPTTTNQTCIS